MPYSLQKSRFLGGYAAGKGINRYFQDPNGLGLDGVFTPATGFELIDSQGWFVAYEQWWADRWTSNFSYSEMHVDVPDVLPDDTYQEGKYVTANLIWLPFDRLGVGIEFLFGERENKDGRNWRSVIAFKPRCSIGFSIAAQMAFPRLLSAKKSGNDVHKKDFHDRHAWKNHRVGDVRPIGWSELV